MTEAAPALRLVGRVRWLGAPDPTWTAADGRPPTPWAVEQALAFVDGIEGAGVLQYAEPQVTATSGGGIEFVWETRSGSEIDVTFPADPDEPIEIARTCRDHDGSLHEDEWTARNVADAVARATSPGT